MAKSVTIRRRAIEAPEKKSKYLYARIKEKNFTFLKSQAKKREMSVTQFVDLLLDKQRGL